MKKSMIIGALMLSGMLVKAQQYNVAAPTAAEHKTETTKNDLTPEERASREAERMAQKLALSREQEEKWRLAVMDRQTATAPIRQKMRGSTTPEERKVLRDKMRENRKSFDSKVEEFLTAEQKKKLEELRVARRGKVKEGRRGGN